MKTSNCGVAVTLGVWGVVFLSAAFAKSAESQAADDSGEQIAAVTDLPQPAGIRDYEIALRTELESNRLVLRTTCTLTNCGAEPLATMLPFSQLLV